MSAVGFDLGNETSVIAVARRGIQVLQNDVGSRVTASTVAFTEGKRAFGSEAKAQQGTNYKNTVEYFKRYLGRNASDPELSFEEPWRKCGYTTTDGDKPAFIVNQAGKQETLSPEAVTGAMLHRLKVLAEQGLDGARVHDCVLACPAYWSDAQRRAYLNAAEIAGLNVLRLINETTACALNYGILRPLPEKEARLVVFLDMGETATTATVVKFQSPGGVGELQVLGTASDRNLGGRSITGVLVDHFVQHVKDTYKMDVTTNAKSMLKMQKECGRVKKVLSANNTVNFAVEYLMNDTDCKGEITREAFEGLCKAKIQTGVKEVVEKALSLAGKTIADLHSCEIIGGSTRVPCVQAALGDLFGKVPIMKTCDSDESVARGCALMCAIMSPSFRVKDFSVKDLTPLAVDLHWGPAPASLDASDASRDGDLTDECQLFVANNVIPSAKVVTFKDRDEPYQLLARYSDKQATALAPGVNPLIGRFIIKGMPKVTAADGTDVKVPKIKVHVRLDVHGILSVSQAQLLEEYEVEEEVEVPAAKKDSKTATPADAEPAAATAPATDADAAAAAADDTKMESESTDAGADDAAPATADGADKMDTEATPAADAAADADAAPATDTAAADAGSADSDVKMAESEAVPTVVKEKVVKKRIRRSDLSCATWTTGGADTKALQLAVEQEVAFTSADAVIAEANELRNALESYALEMRSSIRGELADYIEPAAADAYCSQLTDLEDWVYDDGADAQRSELKAKLAEARTTGDECVRLKWEAEHRGETAAELTKAIDAYAAFANSDDEKYAHIDAAEKAKVLAAVADAKKWLADGLAKIESQSKTVAPECTVALIHNKLDALNNVCRPIQNTKKPKPKKEEKKKAEETKTDEEAKTAEGDAAAADAAGSGDAATSDAKADTPMADGDAPAADAAAADAAPAAEPMETETA